MESVVDNRIKNWENGAQGASDFSVHHPVYGAVHVLACKNKKLAFIKAWFQN